MKANGAPKKIYLSQERDKDGCYIDLMWHKHPYEDMENIQYTRTDAFIEKLENYLKNQFIKDVSVLAGGVVHINFNTAISNLKNYMKGE